MPFSPCFPRPRRAKPSSFRPRLRRLAGLVLALGSAAGMRAVMIDEIQVYADDINVPGQFGLELHFNATPEGRKVSDYAGEITPHGGLRATTEFSYGLSRAFEAGLYLPLEHTASGADDLAGLKLRLKWLPVQPDGKTGGWFAGANCELSWLQRRFEEHHWSLELRTMLGYRGGGWLLAANPVFGWTLAGPDRTARPEFELQLKAARKISPWLSVGPEYYADFGRLGRALPLARQDHVLYAAFDVDLHPWIFNFGVGRGVTGGADRWTVKFIFEVPW